MISAARSLLVAALLAPAGAVLAAGCGERVLLGGDPSPACHDMPCGASCTVDPCAQRTMPVCGAPVMVGFCDGSGTCTDKPPPCAVPPQQCLGKPCGAPCSPCPPNGPGCITGPGPGPSRCDGNGMCVAGPSKCAPPFDPCAGIPCGSPCASCAPMIDGGCPPPPMGMLCDGMGACTSSPVACPGQPPYEPCKQKPCGAACTVCPPADPMCVEPPGPKQCDPMGMCTPNSVTCM